MRATEQTKRNECSTAGLDIKGIPSNNKAFNVNAPPSNKARLLKQRQPKKKYDAKKDVVSDKSLPMALAGENDFEEKDSSPSLINNDGGKKAILKSTVQKPSLCSSHADSGPYPFDSRFAEKKEKKKLDNQSQMGQIHNQFGTADIIPHFNLNRPALLTEREREQMAKRKGLCVRCSIRTQRVSLLRRIPLTNENVYKGHCIKCEPTKVPPQVLRDYEHRNPKIAAPVPRSGIPVPKIAAPAVRSGIPVSKRARDSNIGSSGIRSSGIRKPTEDIQDNVVVPFMAMPGMFPYHADAADDKDES